MILNPASVATGPADWPSLDLSDWEPTYRTLHMWTQIVGKVRLAQAPHVNHWWQVPLYVTPGGLTTSAMPHGRRHFSIDFDFIDHQLYIEDSAGRRRSLDLEPKPVAEFYAQLMAALDQMGLGVKIWPMPVEIGDPIRFDEDRSHASYDPAAVARLHTALRSAERVLQRFRSRFIAKCSPVHFFWGAFDLAVTRFSGRRNPTPPEDRVMREAYSHEVISHGFWPGGDWPIGGRLDGAAFYAYAVPAPENFSQAAVRPAAAKYAPNFGEYLLMYDDVRQAEDPEAAVLDFFQSTYEAGAAVLNWDRKEWEREDGPSK